MFNYNDFLDIKENNFEENELENLLFLSNDLPLRINKLRRKNSPNFYDELIAEIRSLIYNYVTDNQNTICSPVHKYLFLLYYLYKTLLEDSFLNEKFLMNFLFKRIFLFYDSIHPPNYDNILIFNNGILNLCKDKIWPIEVHCLYVIVNKFIFESNLNDVEYLLDYLKDNCSDLEFIKIRKEIQEILFIQLICLDNFKDTKNKLINFNDEETAKNFIENIITKYYDINFKLQSSENENNNNFSNDNVQLKSIYYLFINDFYESDIHLLRCLKNVIINIFTPIDSNILDYFQNCINKNLFINKHLKNKNVCDLNILEKILLNNNIQDVDIKIRNISFLIDILMQKYLGIQSIQEFDVLKFSRFNIIINRLFVDKILFVQTGKKESINSVFEHFIVSQFIYNYMKYQIKDPEHYPLEIRYFAFYSYLKISEYCLKENPFSAYITCITLREIINYLRFEKGFEKQKYEKQSKKSQKSTIDNSNNQNLNSSINKSSSKKKSRRRKSISKSKKKKNKGRKKSVRKSNESNNKKDESIDIEFLENITKTKNEQKNEIKISFVDENLDEPEKIISKALFNYLCLIYSMKIKYKDYSSYFEELYSFIDIYISENIKSLKLDDEWTWLLIYPINFIKNFDLKYSFEKFNFNENIDLDNKIKLIANLSKKIKYCNTQEQLLILDVIYNILNNISDLQNVIKQVKYTEKIKKLNRGLSYLSFNKNYSLIYTKNMSFIEQSLVAIRIFKITNLLFIESIDEFFWMPKSLLDCQNYNEFITIMEKLFNKILCRQSLFPETFVNGIFKTKKYLNKFVSSKNTSKTEKKKEQYILALEYFCKLPLPKLDIKEMSKTKEKIYYLMNLMPKIYDIENDINEKVDLINSILITGEFDLRIILFLICQIINKEILKEDSEEINLINDIFNLMINKEYKFMLNFNLTLYKSLENYSLNLINRYVTFNFPENANFEERKYNEFVEYFNINTTLDRYNEEGRQIQKIYNNWTLIKKKLEKSGTFYKFLKKAEEINYPKTVMNLIEKYIFDIQRESNIHNFCNEDEFKNEEYEANIYKYILLYYKCYSHIDENNLILDNYFNNGPLFSLINKKISEQRKTINKALNFYLSNKNEFYINDFINNINEFFITLDKNTLLNNISLIEKIEESQNFENKGNFIFFSLYRFLSNIMLLNAEDLEINQRQFNFYMLKNSAYEVLLTILNNNNKLYETNISVNYSMILYEIILYLELIDSLYDFNDNIEFNQFKSIISTKLVDLFINKRKVPHLKRYLLVFQFRRFLFNLYNDPISELYCLMDICKVYKSIWETGITKEENANFRSYIIIYLNNLYKISDDLLLNYNKKLFFIPLKYYVKYFGTEKCLYFDLVFEKYKNICGKRTDFSSYKILILSDKMKSKNGVVGLNDDLKKIIKILENKSSKLYKREEGFLLYTDFYLDRLVSDENIFKNIKLYENINHIQLNSIDFEIFNYLECAINICIISDKEKYLRKYMPEIINLFLKINFAYINYNIMNNNSQTLQTQSEAEEKLTRFAYLLQKFRKQIEINKIKIIIPQLIICYQYESTDLYDFAVELLANYAEKNIDLMAYLLSSFLTFREDNLKNIGIKHHKRNDLNDPKFKNYVKTLKRSKNFVCLIKEKLSEKNQNILMGYKEFCEKLTNFYSECRTLSSLNKKDFNLKKITLIDEINNILRKNKIILPTIENINNYDSEIRDNQTIEDKNTNILFLKELDLKTEFLASKEKPMHIKFKVTDINGKINLNKNYDFLLKCDVNDITKEIKTFEIIDEINNIFRIKHFDINDSMSLKRYLIVPIAPTIILAEWLLDSISLSSVIDEQSKMDLIYQEENKDIIKFQNNRASIKKGSIKNEDEKYNILYNYYQYKYFDPNLWYSAKKRYIISTAIWSMTSFLVGLGDRHLGNIMINKKTGEVIHIDFGYVALKGLSLGVPEIVDFRLTMNLRKNLGLFEENGLFNYICVKTLRAFKEYYKTLSSRIEYYQFDPMFDCENDNNTFILFRQNDKFFSLLDDENIKEKVKEMIIKNTNPENLEKMYVWWSPWV